MDISLVLSIAAVVLASAVAVLRVIAPKTANTTDDAVLARLESLEAIVEKLLPAAPEVK